MRDGNQAGGFGNEGDKRKGTATLLALLVGGLGVHKFYHGSWGWGILYIVFIMTFVPAVVSFIEAISYLVMSEEDYNKRYNATPQSPFKW